jgi:hypothetical protein
MFAHLRPAHNELQSTLRNSPTSAAVDCAGNAGGMLQCRASTVPAPSQRRQSMSTTDPIPGQTQSAQSSRQSRQSHRLSLCHGHRHANDRSRARALKRNHDSLRQFAHCRLAQCLLFASVPAR